MKLMELELVNIDNKKSNIAKNDNNINIQRNIIIKDSNNNEIKSIGNNEKEQKWDKIKTYINELINKIIIMENKDQILLKQYLNEIKKTIDNLLEENKKVFEENKKAFEKLDQKSEENKKLLERLDKLQEKSDFKINELNKRITKLEDNVFELKDTLGNIQSRDQAKNFLKFFKRYLTDDDKKKIAENNKKKDEIILKRFEKKFEKYKDNRNFKFIKSLIEHSSSLVGRGNNYAHSLTIDNYIQDIKEFKNENNIKVLCFPEIFCFCINLGLEKEIVKNAYFLFKTHFNKSLRIKKEKIKCFESYIII